MTGAGWFRRMTRIILPLQKSAVGTGILLPFIQPCGNLVSWCFWSPCDSSGHNPDDSLHGTGLVSVLQCDHAGDCFRSGGFYPTHEQAYENRPGERYRRLDYGDYLLRKRC